MRVDGDEIGTSVVTRDNHVYPTYGLFRVVFPLECATRKACARSGALPRHSVKLKAGPRMKKLVQHST
jgi:hypothetical protein